MAEKYISVYDGEGNITDEAGEALHNIFDKNTPDQQKSPVFTITQWNRLCYLSTPSYTASSFIRDIRINPDITMEELLKYVTKDESDAIYIIEVIGMSNGLRDSDCGILKKSEKTGAYEIMEIDMCERQKRSDDMLKKLCSHSPETLTCFSDEECF